MAQILGTSAIKHVVLLFSNYKSKLQGPWQNMYFVSGSYKTYVYEYIFIHNYIYFVVQWKSPFFLYFENKAEKGKC